MTAIEDAATLRISETQRQSIQDVLSRFLSKEQAEARHNVDPKQFVPWLEKYYRRHEDKLASALESIGTDGRGIASQWCSESKRALLRSAECQPDQLQGRIEELITTWAARPAGRAAEIMERTK